MGTGNEVFIGSQGVKLSQVKVAVNSKKAI
jgi:hypothetical protein